jgi:hypothetical protein
MLGSILLLFDFIRERWRSGPRPLVVHAYAVFVSCTVIWLFWTDIPPFEEWERHEAKVVGIFTVLSIGLIPVLAIWGFGSRFARMLVTIMSAPLALAIFMQIWAAFSPDPFEPLILVHATGWLTVVALLFHRSARKWFENKKELPDPQLEF